MTTKIEQLEKQAAATEAKLKETQKKLKAAKQKESAKQKTQQRKDEDARKYIFGGYMLEHLKNINIEKEITIKELYDHMLTTLTRPNDRRVFNLPPLEKSKNTI